MFIRSTLQRVYYALTEQEGLTQWWIPKATAKPEVGFINLFDEGTDGITPMEVTVLLPYEYVEWKCLLKDEWAGTIVSFEIIENNGAVVLNFKHSGWAGETEYFSVCNFHWARHLLTLKTYCETGKGLLDSSKRKPAQVS
ncbi:MAG: SRPBCC domain-containing protein [Mucilaginibacter sp.]